MMGIPAYAQYAINTPFPILNFDQHCESTLKRFAGNVPGPNFVCAQHSDTVHLSLNTSSSSSSSSSSNSNSSSSSSSSSHCQS